ncbi:MAG: DMT family transporter [Thermodesulfobacteriota bacterium]
MASQEIKPQTLTLAALWLVLLVCHLWGGSMPTIKVSEAGIPPLMTAAGRAGVGVLLLALFAWFKGEPILMRGRYLWHGVILGLLFALTMLCLYWGLVFTNASRGVIFYNTKPFWVAIGAHLFLAGDRLTLIKLIGLILALLGVYLALESPAPFLGPAHWWGDAMEIAAALAFSALAVYLKWLSRYPQVTHLHTLFSMMLYALPLLILATLLLEWGTPLKLTLVELLAFLYQSVLAGFLAYLLWFWLIHNYPVSLLASFIFLVPLLGVILSGILLKEPTPKLLWLGLALNVVGIFLVNRPQGFNWVKLWHKLI